MKRLDVAELFVLAALWGGSFLFMRIAAPVLGPIWLIEFRVLIAGLVLLPLVNYLGLLPHLRKHWKPLLLVGAINSALPFSLLAFASVSLPTGVTSILNATSPLFGAVVAALWLKEKLSLLQGVGFLLGFAGVITLMGWQTFALTPIFVLSALAVLAAAVMYAIAAPYIKGHLAGVPSVAVATGSQLGAALTLLPILPFTRPSVILTPLIMGAVLALALLSTALAYILYFRLIENLGSTRALTVTYLIPLFAMFWGALFLKEAITPAMVLGCSLILLGVAIANNLWSTLIALAKL